MYILCRDVSPSLQEHFELFVDRKRFANIEDLGVIHQGLHYLLRRNRVAILLPVTPQYIQKTTHNCINLYGKVRWSTKG